MPDVIGELRAPEERHLRLEGAEVGVRDVGKVSAVDNGDGSILQRAAALRDGLAQLRVLEGIVFLKRLRIFSLFYQKLLKLSRVAYLRYSGLDPCSYIPEINSF